jgi:hypothetical protein
LETINTHERNNVMKKAKAKKGPDPKFAPWTTVHPGLLEMHVAAKRPAPNAFTLVQTLEPYGDGRPVVTLVFDPTMSQHAQSTLAQFFKFAPELWRALRRSNTDQYSTEIPNTALHFGEAWEVLLESAGHAPYETPINHGDDKFDGDELRGEARPLTSKSKMSLGRVR